MVFSLVGCEFKLNVVVGGVLDKGKALLSCMGGFRGSMKIGVRIFWHSQQRGAIEIS